MYILTFLRVFLRIPASIKGFELQQMPEDTRQPEKSICIGTSRFFCYTPVFGTFKKVKVLQAA